MQRQRPASSHVLHPFQALTISLALALGSPAVLADAVSDVQALIASGKPAEGLKKVDEFLAATPNDARLRLQRGLALSLLNRNAEAITVFQKLTETHPDMPGPYNNLAVLYANQGNFEKARQALEQAVRYNPGYATAYQNLGDIHARLAEQAYRKSLSLDKSDLSVPLKLAAVQTVFESQSDPRNARAPAPVTPTPAPTATAAVAPTAVQTPAPKPAAATTQPAPTAQRPVAPATVPASSDPLTAAVISATAARGPVAAPTTAQAAQQAKAPANPAVAQANRVEPSGDNAAADTQAVQKAVQAWTEAWSKRDMFAYIAAYSPDFKGKSPTRKAWEEDRTARIAGKKSITVSVSDVQIKLNGSQATVRFKQDYRSDALSVKSDKTLEMVKSKSGDWQIAQELSN